MKPDAKIYEDLVLEKGFPSGPKSHNTMYYWLKQRQVRRLVRENKQHPKDRIGLVTGIRLQESDRRMGSTISVEVRREGAQLWIQPILHWSRQDLNAYIESEGLERNEVSDHLHRSGECLCGALANPDEIHAIELFYPDTAAYIHDIEAMCEEKGLVDCRWAAPSKAPGRTWHEQEAETGQSHLFPLCSDCVMVPKGSNP
jgi:3'-phosphoadenosine 5'-phosphosulfate sulfotransferase (PAPS reductase)/FAD synthetase